MKHPLGLAQQLAAAGDATAKLRSMWRFAPLFCGRASVFQRPMAAAAFRPLVIEL